MRLTCTLQTWCKREGGHASHLYVADGTEGGRVEVADDAGLAETMKALDDGRGVHIVSFTQETNEVSVQLRQGNTAQWFARHPCWGWGLERGTR